MKKIGIFGGTFNPVHNEHINLIKSAIKELKLDRLFVVPTNIPPHKNVFLAPNKIRLKCLEIALSGIDGVEISDIELKREGISYTYLTVKEFKEKFPNDELYLIVGADMLKDFKNWKNPEKILEDVTLVSADRTGEKKTKSVKREFKKLFNKEFISLSFTGEEISSTKIRAYLSLGLNVKDFVPKKVEQYLKEQNVYVDKYSAFVKDKLKETRLYHTAGVICSALEKVKELNLDEEKVRISATLHDVAKYENAKDYKDFVLPKDVPPPVVHAFLGAYIAETVLGIKDEEIINAIKYHTSGRAKMTELEKLIFTADMIEENRTYKGVEVLRKKVKQNFEAGFRFCLKEETKHLKKSGNVIYKETLNAYNYYCKNKGE